MIAKTAEHFRSSGNHGRVRRTGEAVNFDMSDSSGPITDDYMREKLSQTKPYSIVILHRTVKRDQADADSIIHEHGRRNFQLRREGKLNIVLPIRNATDIAGICIFNVGPEEAKRIYDEDPAVKAGIFVFDVLETRSFPGDALAA